MLFGQYYLEATVELFIILGAIFFNLLLIVLIYRKPNKNVKLLCFDQIYIGHAIVDGVTGLVDIPFFHIENFFGYWPFGNAFSVSWASFDNSINTITALHMLYMSYVRMRSLKCPMTFYNELLIRKPKLTMLFMWLFGMSGKLYYILSK